MSCGCNGSSSAVNAGLNNAFTVNNGYNSLNNGFTQVNNGYNSLNNGFTQAVVNPLNTNYNSVNTNGFTQAVVNPLNTNYNSVNTNGFTQAVVNPLNTNCSSLVGATYMSMSTAEQSYTSNPQVTSVPGIQPVNLSVRSMNYLPSFTVPVLSSQTGFVNYNVRSTPTYVNTCN